jgi:hypothetical protein
MRSIWLAAAGLVLAASARAQKAPIQATQLPPLQEQTQQPGSPPVPQAPIPQAPTPQAPIPQAPIPQAPIPQARGPQTTGPQAPVSPNLPGPGAQGQGQTPPATPPATAEWPNVWVPAGVAKLEALDKVNAQASALTIQVGQSATFGSLTIMVKACVIRPPDQPADAAAYLHVTDSHPDSSGFDGWMLEDEPSVSMMQHPIYDLRVTGCG